MKLQNEAYRGEEGLWPCACEACQRPMKPGDGPRQPCQRGATFQKEIDR